jgi:hypothetical protein
MTEDQAIEIALEYARMNNIPVGGDLDAQYYDLRRLDSMAVTCSPETLETYESVRRQFRNHWTIAIPTIQQPGEVVSPSSTLILVFDDGEVSVFE